MLFSFQLIFSQDDRESQKISLSFENSSRKDVIAQIEEKTGYRFYFVENWLDDKLISGNYENKPVADILDEVFKETVINYYISSDNKVILTQNNLIYDNLPEGFFGKSNLVIDDKASEPVFVTEASSGNSKIETMFLMSDIENQIISSNFVKEIIELGGNIKKFTTPSTIKALKDKYA